jgi:hypothetical protein
MVMTYPTDGLRFGWSVANSAVQNGTPSVMAGVLGRSKYSGGTWPKMNPLEVQVCSAKTIGSIAFIRDAVRLVASNDVDVR